MTALLTALLLTMVVISGPARWNGIPRVVAVADVHGDFHRFAEVLRHAGLIDGNKDWCGGKTHLVQTGDLLDRGPDSRLIMDLVMKLERQAPLQGGMVHQLTGNHEVMNLEGDFRYIHQGEIDSHGGMEKAATALGPRGFYGRWISGHPAVIRINDTVFLHGGVSPEFSAMSPEAINEAVWKAIRSDSLQANVFRGEGPFWYRGWGIDPSTSVERALEQFLDTAGAEYAVVGHTVVEEVETRFGGRVIMIDTGLSRAYGGPGQYIENRGRGWKTMEPNF